MELKKPETDVEQELFDFAFQQYVVNNSDTANWEIYQQLKNGVSIDDLQDVDGADLNYAEYWEPFEYHSGQQIAELIEALYSSLSRLQCVDLNRQVKFYIYPVSDKDGEFYQYIKTDCPPDTITEIIEGADFSQTEDNQIMVEFFGLLESKGYVVIDQLTFTSKELFLPV